MADCKRAILAGTMVATMAFGTAGQAVAQESIEETDRAEATLTGQSANANHASLTAHAPIHGDFAYDQQTITPNSVIRDVFRRATVALCNATDDFVVANPLQWRIAVSGDVDQSFQLPVDELASESSVQQVMTCTCGANPADGAATITADVKGIPVSHLLERAEVQPGANTLTFVSSDGTEVSMPMGYVIGRHAVISYELNGEDLSASVGGNNQLWMTRTSANYFVRDIVEVRVSTEEVPPANPGEDIDYPNSPNVGILSASIN